jgi:glycosyltransferase involved in cell wall biosynthesis
MSYTSVFIINRSDKYDKELIPMKILLLSDIPPCENLTAGLVLSALVRFIPKDSICFYIVSNPLVEIELSPEFSKIPMKLETKPNENWSFFPQRRSLRTLSKVATFAVECVIDKFVVDSKIKDAIAFGQSQNVDRVWAVLQGQTTIRMAKKVADGIGVPLHTHVWDPFSWWATAHGLDNKTRNKVQKKFDEAIKASYSVAVASEPMAELYQANFGVNAIPLIASHSSSLAQKPPVELRDEGVVLIGMAGQFYASSEWESLLKAMDLANWKIKGRDVKVVVLGPQKPPGDYTENRVKYLGWKNQADAATILSLCDILYCPYPFDENLKEVSALSFPSKLVLYLLSGRPVLFHGPSYASPVRYLRERRCGVSVSSLLPTVIYNELERLIQNSNTYQMYAENAQEAFTADFTLESMRDSFSKFIGNEILQRPCYGQHLLDHDAIEFKNIKNMILERKKTYIYLVNDAPVKIKRCFLLLRSWLRHNLVCKIPPFKRFYIEIDYYEKEVSRLRGLSSNNLVEESKAYIIISNEIKDVSDIAFYFDDGVRLFYIVNDDFNIVSYLGNVFRLYLNNNVDELIFDCFDFNKLGVIIDFISMLNLELTCIVESEEERLDIESKFSNVGFKFIHRKLRVID